MPVDLDPPAIGSDKPHHQFKQSGFAAAALTDEHRGLSGRNRQIDRMYGVDRLEPLRYADQLDFRFFGGHKTTTPRPIPWGEIIRVAVREGKRTVPIAFSFIVYRYFEAITREKASFDRYTKIELALIRDSQ